MASEHSVHEWVNQNDGSGLDGTQQPDFDVSGLSSISGGNVSGGNMSRNGSNLSTSGGISAVQQPNLNTSGGSSCRTGENLNSTGSSCQRSHSSRQNAVVPCSNSSPITAGSGQNTSPAPAIKLNVSGLIQLQNVGYPSYANTPPGSSGRAYVNLEPNFNPPRSPCAGGGGVDFLSISGSSCGSGARAASPDPCDRFRNPDQPPLSPVSPARPLGEVMAGYNLPPIERSGVCGINQPSFASTCGSKCSSCNRQSPPSSPASVPGPNSNYTPPCSPEKSRSQPGSPSFQTPPRPNVLLGETMNTSLESGAGLSSIAPPSTISSGSSCPSPIGGRSGPLCGDNLSPYQSGPCPLSSQSPPPNLNFSGFSSCSSGCPSQSPCSRPQSPAPKMGQNASNPRTASPCSRDSPGPAPLSSTCGSGLSNIQQPSFESSYGSYNSGASSIPPPNFDMTGMSGMSGLSSIAPPQMNSSFGSNYTCGSRECSRPMSPASVPSPGSNYTPAGSPNIFRTPPRPNFILGENMNMSGCSRSPGLESIGQPNFDDSIISSIRAPSLNISGGSGLDSFFIPDFNSSSGSSGLAGPMNSTMAPNSPNLMQFSPLRSPPNMIQFSPDASPPNLIQFSPNVSNGSQPGPPGACRRVLQSPANSYANSSVMSDVQAISDLVQEAQEFLRNVTGPSIGGQSFVSNPPSPPNNWQCGRN